MRKYTRVFILFLSFLVVANSLRAEVDKSKYFHIINHNQSNYFWARFDLSNPNYSPNYAAEELDFYYSTDCENWTKFPAATSSSQSGQSINIYSNETIYIKGYHPKGLGSSDGKSSWQLFLYTWGDQEIAGDIMSLVKGDFIEYPDGTTNYDTIPADYCFDRFFTNYTMHDGRYIPVRLNMRLSAKVLKKGCYKQMFMGCTGTSNFTATPSLAAAQVLAPECCMEMFKNCNELTTITDFPQAEVISHSAYRSMFENCNSLSVIPNMVGLREIDDYGCYRMFYNCQNIQKINLSWNLRKIGKFGAYQMFFPASKANTLLIESFPMSVGVVEESGCEEMFYCNHKMNTYKPIHIRRVDRNGMKRMFWLTGYRNVTTDPNATIESVKIDTVGNQGCYEMFYGYWYDYHSWRSQNVRSIQELDIKVVGDSGCMYMFEGCEFLTKIPKICMKKVGKSGCEGMFHDCPAVTEMDTFSIDTIGPRGCYQAFMGNSLLETIKDLHLGEVGDYGCYQMFYNNPQIKALPNNALQFDNIGRQGCYQMFMNTNLQTIPDIRVVKVGKQGCCQMFNGNAALTTGPVMDIVSTDTLALQQMFERCTSMNSIPYLRIDTVGYQGVYYMFGQSSRAKITSIGTRPLQFHIVKDRGLEYMFYYQPITSLPNLSADTMGVLATSNMLNGCSSLNTINNITVDVAKPQAFQSFCESKSTIAEVGNISIRHVGWRGCYQMFYNCNNITSIGKVIIGDPDHIDQCQIEGAGCQSMFNSCKNLDFPETPILAVHHIADSACYTMFASCSKLTNTPDEIVATYIGQRGCQEMFASCPLLTVPSRIRATHIGEYGCYKMFNNQLNIASAPLMDVVTIDSYGCAHMFDGCTALLLPASMPDLKKIRAHGCEYMYNSCTFTKIPPMTMDSIGDYGCQYMFYKCNVLDDVPDFIDLKYVGDYGCLSMFQQCAALKVAPDFPNLTRVGNNGCQSMFQQCTELVHAPQHLPAISLGEQAYYRMFYQDSKLETVPLELPATSITTSCYYEMFSGCKNITQSPIIYAQNCRDMGGNYITKAFYGMFSGCTALKEIKTYQSEWYGDNNDNWVDGVSMNGDFYCIKSLPKEYDVNHIPYNTTYPWNLHILTHMLCDVNGGTWDGFNTNPRSLTPPLNGMPVPMKENCMFVRWDTLANGEGNFALDWRNPLTGDYTYYAVYAPISPITDYAWRDTAVVIRTTRTDITTFTTNLQNDSVEKINTSCRLPGQVNEYLLAYDSASLQKNLGKLMNVMLKNAGGDTLGYVTLRVPYIIKDNVHSSTLVATDNADVWVTKGGVFTVDDVRKIRTLYVTGGGKAIVPEGKTLRTDNIVLSAGRLHLDGTYEFAYPQLIANGSIINASGKVNYDHLTSTNQNYALCLPYTVNLGDVLQENGKYAVTPKKNSSYIAVEYYDGETRLKGGNTTGWKKYFDPAVANSEPYKDLKAGVGYTFYGRGPQYTMEGSSTKYRNAYATFRFPMAIDLTQGEQVVGDSKTISVTPWGFENGEKVDSLKVNDVGWNLVGNPFLADVTISGGLSETNGIGLLDSTRNAQGGWTGGFDWIGNLRYVVIPNNNGTEYTCERVDEVTLPAFRNFFIQIGSGDLLSVQLKNRVHNAPAYYVEDRNEEMMAGVTFGNKEKKDRLGLLVSADYSNNYEINADVDKWMNEGLNIYANIGNYRLAVAAIDDNQASKSIPLTVSTSMEGSYAFALDEKWTPRIDQFSHLYLYDSELRTTTDLLFTPYECMLPKGTHSTRFSLIAQRRGQTDTPTVIEDLPFRQPLISSNKGVLTISGLEDAHVSVYSMLGQCLFNNHQSGELNLSIPQGVYIISINQNGQSTTNQFILQ